MRYTPRHASSAVVPIALLFAAVAAPSLGQSCFVDCDASGSLDIRDFSCFQNAFALGDLARADCDRNGVLDVRDFTCFQNGFALGCPGAPTTTDLAANPLPTYPFAEYAVAFNAGAPISLAIDPTRFPAIAGVTADVYVVGDRAPAQWALDPSLFDVRPSGKQPITFAAGTIQANTFTLAESATLSGDAGAGIGRPYDLVVDMNRNARLDAGDFIDDGSAAEAGFYIIHDLTRPGPMTPVKVDTTLNLAGLGARPVRIIYPSAIGALGKVPVVIIGHGGGHMYTWYDYLQNHLASYGYVTLSHQNDFTLGGSTPRVLLNTDALFQQQATVAQGILKGHLDETRIAFIGHSLGGQEATIGANQLAGGGYVPVAFPRSGLRLVSAIGANSFLEADEGGTPRDYPFHVLYGSADGDISGSPTCGQCQPFRILDRATGFKQSTYVHGADHNDFNCCGFDNFQGPPGTAIGRDEAQRVALAIYLALTKHYLEGNVPARDILWRQWERFKPIGVAATTTVVSTYEPPPLAGKFVIDDYQLQPATDLSSSGGAVTFTVSNLVEGSLTDRDGSFSWTGADPTNGMTYGSAADITRGAVFDWVNVPAFLEFAVVPAGRDFSPYRYLSFRACQGTRHPLTLVRDEDITFAVTLRDSAGHTATINIGAYGGGIEETYRRTGAGTGEGWQNEFETIRIRLPDFQTNGTGLDLKNITTVRFDFGQASGSPEGRLGFDDLEVTAD